MSGGEGDGAPRTDYGGLSLDTGDAIHSPTPRPQVNPRAAASVAQIQGAISGSPAQPLADATVRLASAAVGLPASMQDQIRQCLGPAAALGGASAMAQQFDAHANVVADRQAEIQRNLQRQRDPAALNNPGGCNSIDDAIGSLRGRYNTPLGAIAGGIGLVVGAIAAVPQAILGAVTGAIQALTSAIAGGVSAVINLAIGAVCTASSALTALLSPVTSLLQGISSAVSTVTSAISREIASVANILGGAFVAGTKIVPASFRCLTPDPYTPPATPATPALGTPPT